VDRRAAVRVILGGAGLGGGARGDADTCRGAVEGAGSGVDVGSGPGVVGTGGTGFRAKVAKSAGTAVAGTAIGVLGSTIVALEDVAGGASAGTVVLGDADMGGESLGGTETGGVALGGVTRRGDGRGCSNESIARTPCLNRDVISFIFCISNA
jgi:hypothetical protein